MLVCWSLRPPVTMTSPLGKTTTPGQNMLWSVLVTVSSLTAPVVRFKMAVWVQSSGSLAPKAKSWSADHTSISLLGSKRRRHRNQGEADGRPPLADHRRVRAQGRASEPGPAVLTAFASRFC